MPTDILIYAAVAAVLVNWLRNILGTRHGDERDRPNPYDPAESGGNRPSPADPAKKGQIIDILDAPPPLDAPGPFGQALTGMRDVSIRNPAAEEGLIAIARADRGFDLARFVTGAREAFAMVVEAFAAGDRQTLRDLVAPSVLRDFEQALDDRATRGDSVTTEVHAVRRVEILDAKIETIQGEKTMLITLRITADETCVIRDRMGQITAGNPDRVTEMVDVWTFARAVKSRDPAWLVYETRDDALESHKTPIPEAG